ncbi:MAG: GNAT family N-acetyltransferase [Acidobacteria bacterium]|nr:GNAT family N-acetyltransferase [Acidobacteriota bacterium]
MTAGPVAPEGARPRAPKTEGPVVPGTAGALVRKAGPEEVAALTDLLRASVLGLGAVEYSPRQLASALTHIFGVDTRLIEDGTYFVVEEEGRAVACGGWSRRRTLYGGDQFAGRSDDWLDPAADPARIRAFFVHPDRARRGYGRLLLEFCEAAARAEGFESLELMATLSGVPLYERCGYSREESVEIELPDGVSFPLIRMSKTLKRPAPTGGS